MKQETDHLSGPLLINDKLSSYRFALELFFSHLPQNNPSNLPLA